MSTMKFKNFPIYVNCAFTSDGLLAVSIFDDSDLIVTLCETETLYQQKKKQNKNKKMSQVHGFFIRNSIFGINFRVA